MTPLSRFLNNFLIIYITKSFFSFIIIATFKIARWIPYLNSSSYFGVGYLYVYDSIINYFLDFILLIIIFLVYISSNHFDKIKINLKLIYLSLIGFVPLPAIPFLITGFQNIFNSYSSYGYGSELYSYSTFYQIQPAFTSILAFSYLIKYYKMFNINLYIFKTFFNFYKAFYVILIFVLFNQIGRDNNFNLIVIFLLVCIGLLNISFFVKFLKLALINSKNNLLIVFILLSIFISPLTYILSFLPMFKGNLKAIYEAVLFYQPLITIILLTLYERKHLMKNN